MEDHKVSCQYWHWNVKRLYIKTTVFFGWKTHWSLSLSLMLWKQSQWTGNTHKKKPTTTQNPYSNLRYQGFSYHYKKKKWLTHCQGGKTLAMILENQLLLSIYLRRAVRPFPSYLKLIILQWKYYLQIERPNVKPQSTYKSQKETPQASVWMLNVKIPTVYS